MRIQERKQRTDIPTPEEWGRIIRQSERRDVCDAKITGGGKREVGRWEIQKARKPPISFFFWVVRSHESGYEKNPSFACTKLCIIVCTSGTTA